MSKVKGSIAILGSGETSPNLVTVHRRLINNLGKEVNAYMIDTPFGFQENADELVNKLKEFYEKSINIKICLLYTSPSPRDPKTSRMPSSA